MNNSMVRSFPFTLRAVFAAALMSLSACAACGPGGLPEDSGGSGDGGTHSLSTVDAGMLGCDPTTGCDTYPGGDGGGDTPTTGAVSVTFINALPVQATLYVDGGGYYATTGYHETVWLPVGGRTTLSAAMSGTLGATLTTSTMLAAQNFPHYTLNGSVYLARTAMACTITAMMHPDGYAYLTQACQ